MSSYIHTYSCTYSVEKNSPISCPMQRTSYAASFTSAFRSVIRIARCNLNGPLLRPPPSPASSPPSSLRSPPSSSARCFHNLSPCLSLALVFRNGSPRRFFVVALHLPAIVIRLLRGDEEESRSLSRERLARGGRCCPRHHRARRLGSHNLDAAPRRGTAVPSNVLGAVSFVPAVL